MDSELEEIRNNFNAVLTSGGGRLEERQFINDYRSLIGGQIPFAKFGHKTLQSFVSTLGGFYFRKDSVGRNILHACVDEKTAHISKLIAGQKRKPGASKGGKRRSVSYSRPKLLRPSQLLKKPPTYIVTHQRTSPPSKYGNPPIIPQRQPLSVQSRLEPKQSSIQGRLSKESKERILDVTPVRSVPTEEKGIKPQEEPSYVEPEDEDDVSYVDIQWLQGKISKGRRHEKVGEACQTPQTNHASQARLPVVSQPITQQAPHPLMSIQVSLPSGPLMEPSVGMPRSHLRPSEQKVVCKSSVEELEKLVAQLGLTKPIYKVIERKPSRSKPVYTAKVKIGEDICFSSYPNEKDSRVEAQELVAQVAVEDLKKKQASNFSNSANGKGHLQYYSQPVDENVIVERVLDIIRDRPHGMFEEAINDEYFKQFQSALPLKWLQIIEKSAKFSCDHCLNQKCIVYPVQDSISIELEPKPKPMNSVPYGKELDINANTIMTCADRKMPELILPQEDQWFVYISSVSCDDSYIWVRLIGEEYDTKYNEVMNDLELKMFNNGQIAENPKVDDYFAVKFDNCWLRVQLREINGSKCDVFLIDNGEEDTVELSELKYLSNEYLNLPAQAVRCELSYLDITYEAAQAYLYSNIIGNSYVAEILTQPSEDNCASVVLHNTSEKQPVNINFCILEEIVKSLSPPEAPQRGFFKITEVQKETPPFVQIKGKDLSLLEKILGDVSKLDLVQLYGVNAHPRLNQMIKESHMYLARSLRAPKTWRRGVIVNTDDPKNPMIRFEDYGYTEKVMWSDIFDVDVVVPPLQRFPVQAIQVHLFNLESSKIAYGIVKRIRELVPPELFISGSKKVDVGSGDQLPSVEFFKEIPAENIMCSINSDLLFNYDKYSSLTEETNIQKTSLLPDLQRAGSSGSTSVLPPYVTPPSAEYFDVLVSMSSNPFNFVVQPLKELNSSFDPMMKELQDYYESQHSIMPSPVEADLVENATFAAKHPEDLQWYRVSIGTVINSLTVSVRYDDYGDLGLIATDRLRYLDQRFRQLPALAIRAKLHGVKPKNRDWSVDECVYFNDLVGNKPFVSRVIEINPDGGNNSWRVSLSLIDVSRDNEDVYLANLLVDNDMAYFSN